MTNTQKNMLRVTGYADRLSVRPGDKITFFVHSENEETYQADIVRLIHGDTSSEGPGFKEEVIQSDTNTEYRGIHQPIYAGSYILVPHHTQLDVNSFTLCCYIYPTLTDHGMQGIITKWNE